MTDEERDEILNQAFRNISVEREAKETHVSLLDEDPLEAWERGMPKPEEPRPARKLDTNQPNIFQWIEERLQTEREFILEVVGQGLSELLEEQLKKTKNALADEVRQLRLELTQLELTLTELRIVVAQEKKQMVDQAQLPRLRTVN